MSPEAAIDEHANAILEIAKCLAKQNAALLKRESDLENRIDDALDRVFELETKLRDRDQIIEELQTLIDSRGGK